MVSPFSISVRLCLRADAEGFPLREENSFARFNQGPENAFPKIAHVFMRRR